MGGDRPRLTRPPRSRRPGFTLIEALAAVAILGIGAAGAVAAWSVGAELNRATRAMQAGANVLEQELERVRRLNWDGLPPTPDWVATRYYDAEGNPLGPAATTAAPAHGYVAMVKVEPLAEETLLLGKRWRVDGAGRSGLRRVTVRVRAASEGDAVIAEAITYLATEGY